LDGQRLNPETFMQSDAVFRSVAGDQDVGGVMPLGRQLFGALTRLAIVLF
jgi:hypothetical protein